MLAVWEITDACTNECLHCYNKERYGKRRLRTGGIAADKAYRQIVRQLKDEGFDGVYLVGGEPLMSGKLLEIVREAKTQGMGVGIGTNGMLLVPPLSEALLDAEVDSIVVSLEGASARTNDAVRGDGTFERVLRNVDRFQAARRRKGSAAGFGLSLIANALNLEDIPELYPFAAVHGFDAIAIGFLAKEGGARDNWELLHPDALQMIRAIDRMAAQAGRFPNIALNMDCKPLLIEYLNRKHRIGIGQIDDYRCRATVDHLYITAAGDVLPCSSAGLSRAEAAASGGRFSLESANILKDPLGVIRQSAFFTEFREFALDPESYRRITTCEGCKFRTRCAPCPLQVAVSEGHEYEQCRAVQILYERFKKRILAAVAKPKPESRITVINPAMVLARSDKIESVFEHVQAEILIRLRAGDRIEELVRTVQARVPGADQNKICDDVLDFLFAVEEADIIRIEPRVWSE